MLISIAAADRQQYFHICLPEPLTMARDIFKILCILEASRRGTAITVEFGVNMLTPSYHSSLCVVENRKLLL